MRNHILITINVVDRQGGEHILTTKPGQSTLMDVLYDEDLDVEAVCGGCASCATCHIFVNEDCLDRLPERDDIQNMLLQYQGHFDDKTSSLSCQMPISESLDGIKITIAPEE